MLFRRFFRFRPPYWLCHCEFLLVNIRFIIRKIRNLKYQLPYSFVQFFISWPNVWHLEPSLLVVSAHSVWRIYIFFSSWQDLGTTGHHSHFGANLQFTFCYFLDLKRLLQNFTFLIVSVKCDNVGIV